MSLLPIRIFFSFPLLLLFTSCEHNSYDNEPTCLNTILENDLFICDVLVEIARNDKSISQEEFTAIEHFITSKKRCQKLSSSVLNKNDYYYYFDTLSAEKIDLTQIELNDNICKWSVGTSYSKYFTKGLQPLYFIIKEIVLGTRYQKYLQIKTRLLSTSDEPINIEEILTYTEEIQYLFNEFKETNSTILNDSEYASTYTVKNDFLESLNMKEVFLERYITSVKENIIEDKRINSPNSLDKIEYLECKVGVNDLPFLHIEMLVRGIGDTLIKYEAAIDTVISEKLSIKNIIGKDHVMVDGENFYITFINDKTLVKSTTSNSFDETIKVGNNLMFGKPIVDNEGNKRVIVYIKKNKQNAWRLFPFIVYHEIAHHYQTDYSTSTLEQENDADCFSIEKLLALKRKEGSAYAMAAITLFEQLNLPGGGNHLPTRDRADLMDDCLEVK